MANAYSNFLFGMGTIFCALDAYNIGANGPSFPPISPSAHSFRPS